MSAKNENEGYEYYLIWRNKFLTINAKTIDDMIDILSSATEELKEMRDAGVVLDGGQEDDYAHLVTSNEEVAKRFDMEKFDWDEWEEDEEGGE